MRWSVLSVIAGALVATAMTPAAARCPEAQTLRRDGRAEEAEAAARACVARDSEDVEAWMELSRAVGYQQRFDEALHWAERGLERFPEDADIAAWRVRLLAWSGRVGEARQAYETLVVRAPELLQDPDNAMLQVDLAFWSRDWAAATDGFTAYLSRYPDDAEALRKRGLAWSERGEVDRAVADLSRSCELGGVASCTLVEDVERRGARLSVRLEPLFVSEAHYDLVSTRLEGLFRVVDELYLGLAGDVRLRLVDDGDGLERDTLAHVLASWRTEGFSIESSFGVGPGARFSPRLNAWIEPSVELADGLWARLRAWRMSFASAGATLLSPAVGLDLGPVHAELRYFLSFPDDERATHSGVLRVGVRALEGLRLEAGGGGGNATDSLAAPTATMASHWLILAGAAWQPSWRHEVRLQWVFRRELDDRLSVDRHELLASWRLLF